MDAGNLGRGSVNGVTEDSVAGKTDGRDRNNPRRTRTTKNKGYSVSNGRLSPSRRLC